MDLLELPQLSGGRSAGVGGERSFLKGCRGHSPSCRPQKYVESTVAIASRTVAHHCTPRGRRKRKNATKRPPTSEQNSTSSPPLPNLPQSREELLRTVQHCCELLHDALIVVWRRHRKNASGEANFLPIANKLLISLTQIPRELATALERRFCGGYCFLPFGLGRSS